MLEKQMINFKLNSTFSYREDTISKWYYAGKFNFNTQFY